MVVFRQLKGRAGLNEFDISEELSGEAGGMIGSGNAMGENANELDSKVY
jgi:hypothetical protein